MKSLEQRIAHIEERNKKVEADKAWETSWLRRTIVAVTTYAIVVAFLIIIDNDQPFINAVVPALGYLLSTLALHSIKMKWISKYK